MGKEANVALGGDATNGGRVRGNQWIRRNGVRAAQAAGQRHMQQARRLRLPRLLRRLLGRRFLSHELLAFLLDSHADDQDAE